MNDPYDTTAGTSGTTWKYAYDQGGNIQSKTAYVFTTGTVGSAVKTDSFTYGDTNWKDKLTAFNGQTITYDEIGNPTNDGTWNYTWIGGRQMRAMYKGEFGEQGYDEITFEYNENGLRTKKTRMYFDDATGDIGYKATNYTLHGKNIVHMSDGSNNLHFFYDAQNKPAVVIFNGTAYAYLYNLQGDIIGLVDSNGTKMVSYSYDAWGKPISKTGTLANTLGKLNPFRYCGYIFDEETGLYYLRSRYYNPNLCRFINADDVEAMGADGDINGDQLFIYCMNDPVNNRDEAGSWSLPNWAKVAIGAALIVGAAVVATVATGGVACFAAGAAIGAAKGAVSGAIGGAITGAIQSRIETGSWDGALEAAVGGAAGGVVLATTGNMNAANAVTGTVTTGVGQSLEKLTIKNYNKSWAEIGVNAAVDGAVSYGLGKIPGIKGATAGRNSWSAVYKSGLTKLRNGTAARMSAKVVAKGLGSSIVGGFALDGYYGVKQHAYDRVKSLLN